jgi:hypothetical protein
MWRKSQGCHSQSLPRALTWTVRDEHQNHNKTKHDGFIYVHCLKHYTLEICIRLHRPGYDTSVHNGLRYSQSSVKDIGQDQGYLRLEFKTSLWRFLPVLPTTPRAFLGFLRSLLLSTW